MSTTTRDEIEFSRRGRRERTDCAERTIWISRCGRYRVVRSVYLFGHLPNVYYAQVLRDGRCWDVISQHRKRRTAEAACRRDARRS